MSYLFLSCTEKSGGSNKSNSARAKANQTAPYLNSPKQISLYGNASAKKHEISTALFKDKF